MSSRPVTITLAAAVESLVGLAAAVGGGYVLIETVLGRASDTTSALPLAALAFAAAGVLGYVAWGMFQLRGWARTPVVLTQIFVLVVAYYMGTSEQYAISAVLVAVAAAGIAAALAPPTTSTLFPDDPGGSRAGEGGRGR